MTGFTERQRAELRDAVARSRMEALKISRAYEAKQRLNQRAVQRGQFVAARDLLGLIAENLTALEAAAADLDDDELSRATHDARRAVVRAGNRLVPIARREVTA